MRTEPVSLSASDRCALRIAGACHQRILRSPPPPRCAAGVAASVAVAVAGGVAIGLDDGVPEATAVVVVGAEVPAEVAAVVAAGVSFEPPPPQAASNAAIAGALKPRAAPRLRTSR